MTTAKPTMSVVMDPFRPERYHRTRAELKRTVQPGMTPQEAAFIFLGKLPFLAAVSTLLSMAAASSMSVALPPVYAIGIVAYMLMTISPVISELRKYRKRRHLAATHASDYLLHISAEAKGPMQKCAKMLRSMDPAVREDFRTLWTSVLEADRVLQAMPGHAEALDRITQRVDAVRDARMAQFTRKQAERIAVEQARKAEIDAVEHALELEKEARREGALATLTWANDDDLLEARRATEAVEAGTKNFRALI